MEREREREREREGGRREKGIEERERRADCLVWELVERRQKESDIEMSSTVGRNFGHQFSENRFDYHFLD